LAFLANISLYLENGIRYGHSYNGRRIWTGMRSIEWHHCQCSWTTTNQHANIRRWVSL